MTVDTAIMSESYAEWIRRVLTRARASGGRIVALFDSSVPEPQALLTATIAGAFTAPVTDRYVSAFTGGNPYVVAHLARRYGVDPAQIVCTTGATDALSQLYRVLVKPGQRILVETPGFDLFHDIGVYHGLAVDRFERRAPDFAIDVDRIAAALSPETRLVVLSNLHNPSGIAIPHTTLEALAALVEARNVLVILDEVYGDYADAATRPCAAAAISPNFISVSSLTKIYGLSTLRCGWIVGDAAVIAPVRASSDRFEFGISNLAHAAAALVFDDIDRFDAYSASVIDSARPIVTAAFAQWRRDGLIAGEVPPFGCIAFPRLVGIDDTIAFSDWLSDRCSVIVAPGEYFGAPGHIRIGFAQPPADLAFALDALAEGLAAFPARRARRTESA